MQRPEVTPLAFAVMRSRLLAFEASCSGTAWTVGSRPRCSGFSRTSDVSSSMTAVSRVLADLRRPIRTSTAAGGPVVRLGARHVEVFGPLDQSFDTLAHRNAGCVVSVFEAASVDTFVVGRERDAIVLGVELGRRTDALEALEAALSEPGWLIDWEDGSRSGTVAVRGSRHRRGVLRARRWKIYRAAAWGDRAVGQEQAVQVTFWEPGTSGQLELVGTRGHERFDRRSPVTVEVIDGHEYPGRSAFPVGSDLAQMASPIDIVYTWVDGSDPAWQEAFRETSAPVRTAASMRRPSTRPDTGAGMSCGTHCGRCGLLRLGSTNPYRHGGPGPELAHRGRAPSGLSTTARSCPAMRCRRSTRTPWNRRSTTSMGWPSISSTSTTTCWSGDHSVRRTSSRRMVSLGSSRAGLESRVSKTSGRWPSTPQPGGAVSCWTSDSAGSSSTSRTTRHIPCDEV